MADFLFLLSKLGWALVKPSTLLLVALFAAAHLLWRGRPRAGRVVTLTVALLALAIAALPICDWLLHPLEDRFPPPAAEPAHVDGIVVLGGAVEPRMAELHGGTPLNDSAERMTAFAGLARRHPEARLVFTGGSGALRPGLLTEADIAGRLFADLGVDGARLTLERKSRNTWENAVFSKELMTPLPGETWLLVTSAMHMPRSMGIFRRIGWTMVPWPVAYRTGHDEFDLASRLGRIDDAVREWIGLVAYHLEGRTESWFPAP